MINKKRLVLREDIVMCSGVGCARKEQCYRAALNRFYDVIAREPHPDPRFVEPQADKCSFFLKAEYQSNEKE